MKIWLINMDLLQSFCEHWANKKFVVTDKAVLLAVSGGIDSMVLADLLYRCGVSFAMAHCNFQLRGEEADKDEAIVMQWAIERNITFYVTRFNTQEKADEWKKGIQETARILRYDWLETVRNENKLAAIVTAHHANDNVETLLINLFKGTGMSGLHGIPERNGYIIRPMLFATRDEITLYGAMHSVPYREDASNASDKYLRNAVRHHIIPAVNQCFPNGIQQANESIQRFAQIETIYNKAIEIERKKLTEQRGQDLYVPIRKIQKRESIETLFYELFRPYGFTSAQVPHIIELMSALSGHFVISPTHRIIRDRDFLVVTTLPNSETDLISIDKVPCTIESHNQRFVFSMDKKPTKIPESAAIACVDMKHVTWPLTLRKWRKGDYFYPLGMGMKKKKLSNYFIDQKVALHKKEQAWVLECGKRIVWVAGMRLDERFKIKDSTEQVLYIQMETL
ncbi:MAG: tRNA lysidine(34) synthetase TilS [Bacteroidota bacterium]